MSKKKLSDGMPSLFSDNGASDSSPDLPDNISAGIYLEALDDYDNDENIEKAQEEINRWSEDQNTIQNPLRLGFLNLSAKDLSVLIENNKEVFERVKYLDLGGNNLESLPKSIEELKNVKLLYLGSNNLCSLPEFIGNLNTLEVLHLNSNNLESLPESIGNLDSLKVLHLGSNNLESLPESIGNLNNLEVLHLGDNNLCSLPASMRALKNVEELYLRHNPIDLKGKMLALVDKAYKNTGDFSIGKRMTLDLFKEEIMRCKDRDKLEHIAIKFAKYIVSQLLSSTSRNATVMSILALNDDITNKDLKKTLLDFQSLDVVKSNARSYNKGAIEFDRAIELNRVACENKNELAKSNVEQVVAEYFGNKWGTPTKAMQQVKDLLQEEKIFDCDIKFILEAKSQREESRRGFSIDFESETSRQLKSLFTEDNFASNNRRTLD
ncbi:leucine-rich repeat domain-containing protein, partial [Fangia hongkongensis]|uniref:leucine-rich repeat domain-containing protein n=1 Tax=Fangia hongkongensis TaxID=270495 RepID=UPI0019032E77